MSTFLIDYTTYLPLGKNIFLEFKSITKYELKISIEWFSD